MFGFVKSPANKATKEDLLPPSTANPFDSDDDESNAKQAGQRAKRAASEPVFNNPNIPSDDYRGKGAYPSGTDRYKNDFRDSGGLENQSVQELENYAKYKAEETTESVNNCLRIAEDIRQDATRTLDMLHAQGEQITRTHQMAADIDKDLSKGEKLLNNLGGIFSKPWRPKKTRQITGPLITADNPSKTSENHKEQREKLGLGGKPRGHSAPATPPSEPTNAMQKVELEKAKQDDALSDLSNLLGDLKGMVFEMGSEIDRQNKALDHLSDDVDELNSRVKGANQRARKLLGN